jgi:hypothetical protein
VPIHEWVVPPGYPLHRSNKVGLSGALTLSVFFTPPTTTRIVILEPRSLTATLEARDARDEQGLTVTLDPRSLRILLGEDVE